MMAMTTTLITNKRNKRFPKLPRRVRTKYLCHPRSQMDKPFQNHHPQVQERLDRRWKYGDREMFQDQQLSQSLFQCLQPPHKAVDRQIHLKADEFL